MFTKGKLSELTVYVAHQVYQKYATTTKTGEKILYMGVQKALYGILKSALLFYKQLQHELETNCFKINT